MKKLVEYCFMEVQWTIKSYSIHACVYNWTLAGLNRLVDSHNYYWYAFDCVAHSIDPDEWEFLGHVRHARLAPHGARLTYDYFIKVGRPNEIADHQLRKLHRLHNCSKSKFSSLQQ